MKRIISVVLATLTIAMSAFALTSCGEKHECDFCNEEKKCEVKSVWGEEIYVCDDCMDELNDMFG